MSGDVGAHPGVQALLHLAEPLGDDLQHRDRDARVLLEEGIEGLIHISQLSSERIDKPSSLFKVGDEVDALVVQLDPKERRIGLSIKALKAHEEREEMQEYLRREHEKARFSMEDLLNEELRLDREDGERRASRGRGGDR